MPVRLNDRVRIRMGNLAMTAHPMHLHAHHFAVSCTDGGWVPETAQIPEATTDVPVGTVRAISRRGSILIVLIENSMLLVMTLIEVLLIARAVMSKS
jgi:FtsP/CotA-like multicopper oxidase with cupredoxin domain